MWTKARSLWRKIQFCPPRWAILCTPAYIVRRGLYQAVRRHASRLHGRVLDFGAGTSPFRHLITCDEYLGVDIEESGHEAAHKTAEVFYDGKSLPFPDDHFDGIISTEVFEHVFNLPQVLDELRRVLRPGGTLLATVPFVWDEHEIPYDFARYTCYGLRALLEEYGFQIEVSEKTTGYIATIAQMMSIYIVQRPFFQRHKPLKFIATLCLAVPINITGVIVDALLPKDDRFYHNNVVVAVKPRLH